MSKLYPRVEIHARLTHEMDGSLNLVIDEHFIPIRLQAKDVELVRDLLPIMVGRHMLDVLSEKSEGAANQ